jgi:hypothetical protein
MSMLGGMVLKFRAGFWKVKAAMMELLASNSVLTGSISEVLVMDS